MNHSLLQRIRQAAPEPSSPGDVRAFRSFTLRRDAYLSVFRARRRRLSQEIGLRALSWKRFSIAIDMAKKELSDVSVFPVDPRCLRFDRCNNSLRVEASVLCLTTHAQFVFCIELLRSDLDCQTNTTAHTATFRMKEFASDISRVTISRHRRRQIATSGKN